MRLSEVRHQEAAQDRLQRAFRAGRMPHAYLLTGPHGIGKEMLATRLAAMLLCERPVEVPPPAEATGDGSPWKDACGQCIDCELMAAGTHPDFRRVYRELNKLHPDKEVRDRKSTVLGIDVIRHFLIKPAGLSPSRGRAKVFVVVEGERLHPAAQNAMLKTLEEPPDCSYIVLLATSTDALLATTISRCHCVALQRLPTDFIRDHLTAQHGASVPAATFLAEASEGSVGTAIRFLECDLYAAAGALLELLGRTPADPLGCGATLLESGLEIAKTLKQLARTVEETRDAPQEPAVGDESEDEEQEEGSKKTSVELHLRRLGLEMLLATISTILRDVQRTVVGHEVAALPGVARVGELAARTTTEAVRSAIQAVRTAEYHIHDNVNVKLVFDTLGIELGRGLAPGESER